MGRESVPGNPQLIIFHASRSKVEEYMDGISPALTARCGTGGGNVPMITENGNPTGNGVNEDVYFTINTVDQHAITFSDTHAALSASEGPKGPSSQMLSNPEENFVTQPGCITGRSDCNAETGVNKPMITENDYPTVIPDISGTCSAKWHKGSGGPAGDEMQNMVAKAPDYRIRRLTPLECGRLQGFPDDWTEDLSIIFPEEEQIETWLRRWEDAGRPKSRNQIIKWLYNPVSDSALYKMWGNGVALPCVLFVMEGIAKHKQMEDEK